MLDQTFRVQTAHGTVLAFDLENRRLVHRLAADLSARYPAALLTIPAESGDLVFLLADNPEAIAVAPVYEDPAGSILTLKRHRLAAPSSFAFCHPHRRQYLLVHPTLEADGSGFVALHALEPAPWETCQLIDCLPSDDTASVRSQLAVIQRASDAMPDGLFTLLRRTAGAERREFARLCSDMLSPWDAERLGADLLANPALNAELAILLPEDVWAGTALPSLRDHLRGRTGAVSSPASLPGPPAIDSSMDHLAEAGFNGEYTSIAQQCNAALRRTVPPRKDLCIVATARNEGLYLLDWIAYHRSVGVDHIFLYTNNNADGSGELLQALAAAGEITLIENTLQPGVSPQRKAYAHAFGMLPDVLDYRWCAVIDVDEFIGFDRTLFDTVKDYVAWQEQHPVDAIALSWLLMGSSGAPRWRPTPLPQRCRTRFTQAADHHIKMILRPRLFHHSHPHVPRFGGGLSLICRDAGGDLRSIRDSLSSAPKDAPAWIAHYYFRSAEEFVWKFSRRGGGRPLDPAVNELAVPPDFMFQFVSQHRLAGFVDDRTLRCAEGMEAGAARLASLPGVAAARAKIVQYYQRRSASLAAIVQQRLPSAATDVERQFYADILEGVTAMA